MRRSLSLALACALLAYASPSTDPAYGSSRVDLGDTVHDAHAIVIARDGTMYFGQPSAIGRRLPDGTIETRWMTLDEPNMTTKLTLDAANATLFTTTGFSPNLESPH